MAHRAWLTPAELDSAAESLATAYRGYLTGMVATLAGTFDRPNASTPRAMKELREATFQTLLGFLGHSSTMGRAMTARAKDGGTSVVGISEKDDLELVEMMDAYLDDLQSDLMAIGMRDWVTVRRTMNRFVLEAQNARGRYGRASTLFVRQGKIANLKFRQVDRAGRQWESGLFVRNLVRHHLVQVQADCACFAQRRAGKDTLTVTWPVALLAERAPISFSISGKDPELRSYATEIRDEIFHPNSTARLEP